MRWNCATGLHWSWLQHVVWLTLKCQTVSELFPCGTRLIWWLSLCLWVIPVYFAVPEFKFPTLSGTSGSYFGNNRFSLIMLLVGICWWMRMYYFMEECVCLCMHTYVSAWVCLSVFVCDCMCACVCVSVSVHVLPHWTKKVCRVLVACWTKVIC